MKNHVLFPKGEFLKELSEGSHWFEWLSSPCLIVSKFSSPYDIRNYCAGGGGGGGAYLPFGTFDHVGAIFFKFLELYGVWP